MEGEYQTLFFFSKNFFFWNFSFQPIFVLVMANSTQEINDTYEKILSVLDSNSISASRYREGGEILRLEVYVAFAVSLKALEIESLLKEFNVRVIEMPNQDKIYIKAITL